MATATNNRRREAQAAGLSGGTGFAGVVLLLPDGILKSVLLILAPAFTIVISSTWELLVEEISSRVADWRIRVQKRRLQKLLCSHEITANPTLKGEAQKDLEALILLEVAISKRRVQAIVSS